MARKYAAFTLVIDAVRLLDPPDDTTRPTSVELERRYDATDRVRGTQYAKKDWHQRLGSGVHADATGDPTVHNTI